MPTYARLPSAPAGSDLDAGLEQWWEAYTGTGIYGGTATRIKNGQTVANAALVDPTTIQSLFVQATQVGLVPNTRVGFVDFIYWRRIGTQAWITIHREDFIAFISWAGLSPANRTQAAFDNNVSNWRTTAKFFGGTQYDPEIGVRALEITWGFTAQPPPPNLATLQQLAAADATKRGIDPSTGLTGTTGVLPGQLLPGLTGLNGATVGGTNAPSYNPNPLSVNDPNYWVDRTALPPVLRPPDIKDPNTPISLGGGSIKDIGVVDRTQATPNTSLGDVTAGSGGGLAGVLDTVTPTGWLVIAVVAALILFSKGR
jgi:hypothetical protein